MASDSANVDTALVARLAGDSTLMGLLPDGVYFDVARQDAKRFVLLQLATHQDVQRFAGAAMEDALYRIVGVELVGLQQTPSSTNVQAAAQRIRELLTVPLDVPGFAVSAIRRQSRIRSLASDDVDPSIRWQEHGGMYQVVAAPTDDAGTE